MADSGGSSGDENDTKKRGAKNAADLQRIRLERLMKNPEKPVFIPEPPKEKTFKPPPEFVRNVWGSSAGAGSGEFHVYRNIRRREYARQKFLDEDLHRKTSNEKYHLKLEENKIQADEKTAKKRAKRLKKKQKSKKQKVENTGEKQNKSDNETNESEESDRGEDEGKDDAEEQSFVAGGR